ncbi:hypothetical protein [Runella sp. SP2]|uniref:hypothetical protein n=1 Tax=Runella sp. SP2 TaxID=2268026 RepID=UPI000F07B431|nr:hypothetical protein [Runella sp. SP2]AYQ31375.1 hypothetical protein DTQ70_03920 [Runella sp. SP2]
MTLIERINSLATSIANTIKVRSVPAGGAAGNVLTKTGSGDYAMSWQNPAVTQTDIEKARIRSWFL